MTDETETWQCGHGRTPENTERVGSGNPRCRQCRIIGKRKWRERQREIAEGAPKRKTGCAPHPATVAANDGMSAEAYGSRRLLEAYHRYYQRHVAGKAA